MNDNPVVILWCNLAKIFTDAVNSAQDWATDDLELADKAIALADRAETCYQRACKALGNGDV